MLTCDRVGEVVVNAWYLLGEGSSRERRYWIAMKGGTKDHGQLERVRMEKGAYHDHSTV
jgi:hypothetical protein